MRKTIDRAHLGAALVAASTLFYWPALLRDPFAAPNVFALHAAALALASRSLVANVLARGAASFVLIAHLTRTWGHGPTLASTTFAVALGAALALTRGRLASPDARATFAPVRFREPLLFGATAMATAATGAAFFAVLLWQSRLALFFNSGLAALLALAVVGCLRMRAWGVLLGGAVSLGCLALTPFFGAANAVTLGAAAAPALLFWVGPILATRTRVATPVRVATAELASRALPLDEDGEAQAGTPRGARGF